MGELPERARRGVRLAQRPDRQCRVDGPAHEPVRDPAAAEHRFLEHGPRLPVRAAWPQPLRALHLQHGLQPQRPQPGFGDRLRRVLGQPSAGRKTVLTKIKNPTTSSGQLTIAINGKTVVGPATIPAGQTVNLRSPLPDGATDVSVRYTGAKTLVLLETSFQ